MNTDEYIVECFRRAAADRERGAAEIEEALVRGLLALGSKLEPAALVAGARLLAEGQPAMANLRSLATRAASPGFRRFLEQRAGVLDTLSHRLAASGWPYLERSNTVVTISRSTAVAAVVEGAWDRGWRGSVVVLDGTVTGCGQDQARRLARIYHQVSSRGRRGAVPSEVFDLRGAESYLTVRRAPRGEKTPLGAVHRRPQQKAGEICGLTASGKAVSRPDATAPSCLDTSGVVVLVGADAVGPQRFINAAGTTMLMELAAARGLQRVLAADSGKDVSEQELDEIADVLPRHSDSPDREWPVFEVIPMNLVSTRITE